MMNDLSEQDRAFDIASIPGLLTLWQHTRGSQEICIAVLDSQVDLSHPCFVGAQLETIDFLQKQSAHTAASHGTHVASIIFGQPGTEVTGVAPHCRGILIPVYRTDDDGRILPCMQLDLARAITTAAERGANIINISGGELSPSGQAEPLLAEAVAQCAKAGILIVAATGNDGCHCLHVPASAPTVLAVGAMDSHGEPLGFSNWGDAYTTNGLLLPGHNIQGAVPGGGTAVRTGTSYAAPIASGIAALFMSLQMAAGNKAEGQAIRNLLLKNSTPCDPSNDTDCRRILAGRINIPGALEEISQGITSTIHQPNSTKGVLMSDVLQTQQFQTEAPQTPFVESEGSAASLASAPTGGVLTSGIDPSDCSCQSKSSDKSSSEGGCSCKDKSGSTPPPQLVYALGQIGYDFNAEQRRDSFFQQTGRNVTNAAELMEYFDSDPASAGSLTWTLNIDATTVYAIVPVGAFAAETYTRLREFVKAQIHEGVERVSIPGVIRGSIRLLSGQVVPAVVPELRGMYSWSTQMLISAVLGEAPKGREALAEHHEKSTHIHNFLARVYYEIRNLGVASQDRAMNYAATNAFQLQSVYGDAIRSGMKLDTIDVERSPICRPGSDCWDVKLTFFNPTKRLEQARRVYRFTIDVSDVVPITVGEVRNWDVY